MYYIVGKVVEKGNDFIVVENNGIGYKLILASIIPCEVGQEVKAFVFKYKTEYESFELGFLNDAEIIMFKTLIGTRGVGVKTAASIMRKLSLEEICTAAVENNPKVFSKLHNIGKRIAENIVAEINNAYASMKNYDDPKFDSARKALLKLGFKLKEINEALSLVSCNAKDDNAIIRNVIRIIKNG